jgi:predicted RNA-binding Zn-ribbon protein involved in translation (DUF1610 family)/DNA polymerase elongation subunit (family B)
MKILTLDIETSPNLADVWGLFNQNVSLNQLRESTRVMCFAAKWHGKPKVMFHSEFHDGFDVMVDRAYDLLDEADVVVGYNSKGFDIKHLTREFILADKTPPSSFQQIDLLQVVRSKFRFTSNKLDHVASQLGLGSKASHAGHTLWVKCMAGDKAAWNSMRKYNKQDVVLTEQLYDRVRPWMTNHPSHSLYDGAADTCPNCGGEELIRRGFKYTNLGKYQQYRCSGCGAWSRSGRSEQLTDLRGSA